jgi:hypothetical protein
VSTTGTVAIAPTTTATPTTQTTVPDDDAYPAVVGAWLDTYAANLEEAVGAFRQSTWKGTPEQLERAGAAADLARDAFNSFRAIEPGLYLWEYHYSYLMLLNRLVEDFDELARGEALSAFWGFPSVSDVEKERHTLEQMLGLPAS